MFGRQSGKRKEKKQIENEMKLFDKNTKRRWNEWWIVTVTQTTNNIQFYDQILTYTRSHAHTHDSLNLDSWYCFYKWICHLRIAKKQTHTHSVMYQPIIVQLVRKLFEGKKLQTWNWNCSRHPSCAKINTVPAVFYWPIRLWMCVCVCSQWNISMWKSGVGVFSQRKTANCVD